MSPTPAEGRERTQKLVRTWNPACAAEITVAVLGGAWKPTILMELDRRGVLRFNELSRALPNPTPRVLARQLRELEQDGLLRREVFPEVPPRVEYRLTDAGRGAQRVLAAMTDWGRAYSDALGERTVDHDQPAEG
ncbi:helix-turn-helix domain-containing protein [Tsukamurella sp. 1534]|uniref:winged helix-turn-helix transcriptional regulator n=1 Tax=Tsukamurella sp. 1534 TaxID=1151061 RepID=UPI0002DF61CD|nr:helix-turn-helix domain-containing protein [Tsukamurella sp. 1534]